MKGTINIAKGHGVNVYALPNNNIESFAVLESGDQVEVLAIKGDFSQISSDGIFGWVASKFITVDAKTLNGVIAKASAKTAKKVAKSFKSNPDAAKVANTLNTNKVKTAKVARGNGKKVYLANKTAAAPATSKTAVGGIFDDIKEFFGFKKSESVTPEVKSGLTAGQVMYVNTESSPLRLRKSASTNADVVAQLERGSQVTISNGNATQADGWTWVMVSQGGKSGYVAAEYLSMTAPSSVTTPTDDNNNLNTENMVSLSDNSKSWLKKIAIGAVVVGAGYGIYRIVKSGSKSGSSKKIDGKALNGVGKRRRRKMKKGSFKRIDLK